jgi:hypothetical protein
VKPTSRRTLQAMSVSQIDAVLRVLDTLGLRLDDLSRITKDRHFAKRLVAAWKNGATAGAPHTDNSIQARARGIMGDNYLGPEEVRQGYGVIYADDEVAALGEIPFPVKTLQACNKTHVLVAGSPLTINDIHSKADDAFGRIEWNRREPFAKNQRVRIGWYLLRRDAVSGSTNKTYPDQATLLTNEEEVPHACEVVYMAALYYLTWRKRLLLDSDVVCCDKDSKHHHVAVGSYRGRLNVHHGWMGITSLNHLGLASSRKRCQVIVQRCRS